VSERKGRSDTIKYKLLLTCHGRMPKILVSVHAHIVISTELSFRPKGEILNAHDCDILCVSAHELEQ